ncbi:2876_t:CDS:2, partial [Scutellospora calospora]
METIQEVVMESTKTTSSTFTSNKDKMAMNNTNNSLPNLAVAKQKFVSLSRAIDAAEAKIAKASSYAVSSLYELKIKAPVMFDAEVIVNLNRTIYTSVVDTSVTVLGDKLLNLREAYNNIVTEFNEELAASRKILLDEKDARSPKAERQKTPKAQKTKARLYNELRKKSLKDISLFFVNDKILDISFEIVSYQNLCKEISKRNKIHKSKFGINKKLNKAFRFLVENNLVVIYADKNMGLTIIDFAWYNDQVKKHLGDQTVYVKMQNEWVFESINAYAELFGIVYDYPNKIITD